MNYTQRFFLISVLTSVVAMLLAYVMKSYWLGALAAVGLGFLGWFGQYKQKWFWSIHLFLSGIGGLIIIGVILGLNLYFLLPAILAALAAWDLARFQQRAIDTQGSDNAQNVEKRHLGLLALSLGSGGILAGIVLTTRIQFNFGIILALGVILIISFGQIYRMVNN
jgi:hypothetical protein